MRAYLVGVLALALLGVPAVAAGPDVPLPVVSTWGELLSLPPIDLGGGATVRLGIEADRCPRWSGVLVYAYTANVSVGKMFIASLIPGLLVVVSFIPFALRGRRWDTAMTAVLGSACGFAATNVAMKLMADDIGHDQWVRAVIWLSVAALVGFGATVSGMTALQRARATTVIPISTAVQTFLPVALEPLFLQESFRDASLAGVPLVVGLVVMLIGVVMLARCRPVSEIAAGGARPVPSPS